MTGPRDPGLQPERTALAWNRTGISMLVVGLLLMRGGMRAEDTVLTVASVLIVLAAAGLMIVANRRRQVLMANPGKLAVRAAAVTTGVVVLAVGVAVVSSLW